MPVKSAPYYWLECDGCGELADYDEFSAFKDFSTAIDRAEEWTRDGEKFHCSACPPLDAEDGNEPNALSKALMKSRPELTGRVHYVNGRPWCDGVNHTTMCQPEAEDAEVTP